MDKLLPAIVVAALSSLTYLAYKHPVAYRRICVPLLAAGGTVYLGIMYWDLVVELTFGKILQYIPSDKFRAAENARDSFEISIPWLFIIFFSCYAYLLFLSFLPKILEEKKPVEEQDHDKND